MPKVCLVLIVKNEERVIERCLKACLPHVDSWCIVDTGSTDRTMELIRETMSGVPGELHERPWVGMSHNRTELMELARAQVDGQGFLLMIDADDTWTPDPTFAWPDLEAADAWEVHVTLGRLGHYRIHLTRASHPWRYEGAAHEVLAGGPPGWRKKRLRGVKIACGNDGHRRATEGVEKYRRVALQLEAALEENPGDLRALFYCAQSWRDAGEKEKALALYERRAKGPVEEEAWFSELMVAELKRQLGLPVDEVAAAYISAYERRPSRAEPLLWLAQFYRKHKRHGLAYAYAAAAKEIPRPSDRLFVYESVYEWEALDEFATNCTHVGRYAEAAAVMRKLLRLPDVPKSEKKRLTKNLDRCEAPLAKAAVVYGDRVTVAMSTYQCRDGEAFVAAVRSILEQTYRNLLLVVVCDGDESSPFGLLPPDLIQDKRLVLHHNPTNHGQFFCHEIVRRATPDRMITVQDDDDVSTPDRLEKLVRRMVHDRADVAFSDVTRVYPDGRQRVFWSNADVLAEEPLEAFVHVGSHVALFRTEAIWAVGGYFGGFRLGYDTMLGMTISRLGRPTFVHAPLYTYHQRSDSMTKRSATGHGSRKRRRAIDQMVDIWRRVVRHQDPARELRETLAQRITPDDNKDLTAMTESLSAKLPSPTGLEPLSKLLRSHDHTVLPSSLAHLREQYVNNVSKRKDMAVSVATGHLLFELLTAQAGEAAMMGDDDEEILVLDVGSGYSTAVLRSVSGVEVTTVDHDPEWLGKTRVFVEAMCPAIAGSDTTTEDASWMTWAHFVENELDDPTPFDLIVNDLGGMERRAASLPILWNLLRDDGLMLLDDMHKPEYRQAVHQFLETVPHEQFDVREATTDSFGRFAYLVRKKGSDA